MDPAKIDENLAFFKSQILPRIKAGAGFQAVRSMANHKTGPGIAGTVWKSQDAMKAAAETAKSPREQGKRGA